MNVPFQCNEINIKFFVSLQLFYVSLNFFYSVIKFIQNGIGQEKEQILTMTTSILLSTTFSTFNTRNDQKLFYMMNTILFLLFLHENLHAALFQSVF